MQMEKYVITTNHYQQNSYTKQQATNQTRNTQHNPNETSNFNCEVKYLLLIIWVYLDIDLHKMTSVADPNEDKNHFWVFSSRPKRIWAKFWNLFREENIVTDDLKFMKRGEIEFDLENYILEYKLDCIVCNENIFIKKGN